MKKVAISLITIFTITGFLSAINVNATGTLSFQNVDIPNLTGSIRTGFYTKENYTDQWAVKITAKDNLSGHERGIKVNTFSQDKADSGWTTLVKDVNTNINHGSLHNLPGDYQLVIMHTKVMLTGSHFWGNWFYDHNFDI